MVFILSKKSIIIMNVIKIVNGIPLLNIKLTPNPISRGISVNKISLIMNARLSHKYFPLDSGYIRGILVKNYANDFLNVVRM